MFYGDTGSNNEYSAYLMELGGESNKGIWCDRMTEDFRPYTCFKPGDIEVLLQLGCQGWLGLLESLLSPFLL